MASASAPCRPPAGAIAALLALVVPGPREAVGQEWTPLSRGSDNVEVVAHVPLGPRLSATDVDIEQELDRPYAYVSRADVVGGGQRGVDIVDLSQPESPRVLYCWRIEDADLHIGPGGMDVKHFK